MKSLLSLFAIAALSVTAVGTAYGSDRNIIGPEDDTTGTTAPGGTDTTAPETETDTTTPGGTGTDTTAPAPQGAAPAPESGEAEGGVGLMDRARNAADRAGDATSNAADRAGDAAAGAAGAAGGALNRATNGAATGRGQAEEGETMVEQTNELRQSIHEVAQAVSRNNADLGLADQKSMFDTMVTDVDGLKSRLDSAETDQAARKTELPAVLGTLSNSLTQMAQTFEGASGLKVSNNLVDEIDDVREEVNDVVDAAVKAGPTMGFTDWNTRMESIEAQRAKIREAEAKLKENAGETDELKRKNVVDSLRSLGDAVKQISSAVQS